MPFTDAVSTPASASDPLTSAARYISGDTAIVRVPEAVTLALGLSDGTRLLWTGVDDSLVQVTVTLEEIEWKAYLDATPEHSFPVPATSVVRYVEDAIAVVRIPPAFAQVLDLVDTARLQWAVVADRVARVTVDPKDVERVRAIRVQEDDRVIEGLTRGFGAIPDYPLDDDD